VVQEELEQKLGEWDGNPYRTPLGHWVVPLPRPVNELVDYVKEIEGDEEYWI
jgi:hypothetical protein